MLTLTRREGERIAIGDDIVITVVDIGRGKVRIGIDAPRSLAVHRAEVLDRIIEANRLAASALSPDAQGAEGAILEFSEGLPGLREHKRFFLADVPDQRDVRALVSELDPFVRLLVVEALQLDPGYPVDDAQRRSGLRDEEVAVAVVVTLPRDGRPPTANLLAPIVLGLGSRRGVQVILDGSGYSAATELVDVPSPDSQLPPASAG